MSKFCISDELWAKIEPLLPRDINKHRFGGGRPRRPDREVMDAIFFVLRTGCQWNALNRASSCSSSTAHLRFQQWRAAGVFQKLWALSLEEYDELKGLDWTWQSMDGAMTKAPLGGEKNRSQPHGQGKKRSETQSFDRRFRRTNRSGHRGRQSE